ncbi:hypothetical protein CDAR_171641 [Caerostris darwini]|uniref:Uncharacterized protein n=1 Tax=Caerostris darwini TaxID=1538125 RepID=A0AAV4WPU5_9ARAC|nr:hypothetical protein CDAR_171641 [Caerostris darwini]
MGNPPEMHQGKRKAGTALESLVWPEYSFVTLVHDRPTFSERVIFNDSSLLQFCKQIHYYVLCYCCPIALNFDCKLRFVEATVQFSGTVLGSLICPQYSPL